MIKYESDLYFLAKRKDELPNGVAASYPTDGLPFLTLYPEEWGSKLLVSVGTMHPAFKRLNEDTARIRRQRRKYVELSDNEAIVAFLGLRNLSSRVQTGNLGGLIHKPSRVSHTIESLENNIDLHLLQGEMPFAFIQPHMDQKHGFVERLVKITAGDPPIAFMVTAGPTAALLSQS